MSEKRLPTIREDIRNRPAPYIWLVVTGAIIAYQFATGNLELAGVSGADLPQAYRRWNCLVTMDDRTIKSCDLSIEWDDRNFPPLHDSILRQMRGRYQYVTSIGYAVSRDKMTNNHDTLKYSIYRHDKLGGKFFPSVYDPDNWRSDFEDSGAERFITEQLGGEGHDGSWVVFQFPSEAFDQQGFVDILAQHVVDIASSKITSIEFSHGIREGDSPYMPILIENIDITYELPLPGGGSLEKTITLVRDKFNGEEPGSVSENYELIDPGGMSFEDQVLLKEIYEAVYEELP